MPGKAASSISWSSATVMAAEGGEGVAGAVVCVRGVGHEGGAYPPGAWHLPAAQGIVR